MIREDWFSTPIWVEDNFLTENEFNAIYNFVYETRDSDKEGRIISNVGGWQSNEIREYSFKSKGWDFYPQKIFVKANTILDELSCSDFVNNLLVASWININKNNDYNVDHIHSRSALSCVFYLTYGSKIIFKAPRSDMSYYLDNTIVSRGETILSYKEVSYEPKPNRLIFFPSFLIHSVEPSNSNDVRISIASNVLFGQKWLILKL